MSDARPPCPKCSHPQVSKNGHVQSVQRWKCQARDCAYEFTRTTPRGEPAAKKALALLLYSMGRASYGIIARVLKVSRTTVYRRVRQYATQLPEPTIPLEVKEIEFDEMWALYWIQKNLCWLWKALDRHTRRVLAWVVGRRDAATFRRLYERGKGAGRVYYTDDWPSYSAVLPKEQHVIGKTDTHTIERDNANTRHYLARMTRRGKVVSKSLLMVDLTMKLHVAFTNPATYSAWQEILLSVFQ